MSDVSVIISSCDKYRYLWDIQLQLFEKYWPDCPYNIYMISENSKLPDKSYGNLKLHNYNSNVVPTGPGDWSSNLVNFLQTIDSEYVIYLQEDYVFIRDVEQLKLEKLISFAQNNNINYIRFHTSPSGNGNVLQITDDLSIKEITKGTQWRNSLMLAVWKKNILFSMILYTMLTKKTRITPWDFELASSFFDVDNFYCINLPDGNTDILPFMGIYGSSNNHTFYPEAVEFLKKENIIHVENEPINFNIKL